ncbi:MAG: ATP phosphoribosyltransferase regulatory subunit [Clostridia bacterium]|nr:ATP phosphoribosyltransferase regulatory subunit [Clostridia bacterium]
MSISEKNSISGKLMSLFAGCGYTQYKMSKFEEYELYAENKAFLPSKSIITFTDTDGRLMALKPDVTLSIVKNFRDGNTEKLYYKESVYRTDSNTSAFAEITQAGIEYIGDVDIVGLSEVLSIAQCSLERVSAQNVLDVSSLGLLSALLDRLGADGETRLRLLHCVEHKNVHEAAAICDEAQVCTENKTLLLQIMTLDPDPDNACAVLCSLDAGDGWGKEAENFKKVLSALDKSKLRVDFSVLNDTNYYNGLVFRGYINGVPSAVLSGGQYDMLMRRLKKTSSAVGFAVYLDRLDVFSGKAEAPYYDTLVLYGKNTDAKAVCEIIRSAAKSGMTVKTSKETPENVKYGKLVDLR